MQKEKQRDIEKGRVYEFDPILPSPFLYMVGFGEAGFFIFVWDSWDGLRNVEGDM